MMLDRWLREARVSERPACKAEGSYRRVLREYHSGSRLSAVLRNTIRSAIPSAVETMTIGRVIGYAWAPLSGSCARSFQVRPE